MKGAVPDGTALFLIHDGTFMKITIYKYLYSIL